MSGTLGEIDVDYVKVWQRHPEADQHVQICPTPQLPVLGPDVVCQTSAETYTLGQAMPNAQWSVSPGIDLLPSTTAAAAQVALGANPPEQGIITCTYGDAGCPLLTTTKKIDLGIPGVPIVIASKTNVGNSTFYNLSATRRAGSYNAPTTFDWTIYYGPNYGRTYRASGQYVRTPVFYTAEGSENGIKWTLKISNNCGSRTASGQLINQFTPLHRDDNAGVKEDESLITVRAIITDSAAYEQAIYDRVAATMFAEGTGEEVIRTKIDQIAMEELAPYLILDSETVAATNAAHRGVNTIATTAAPSAAETHIYPNPTTGIVKVSPSQAYAKGNIQATVYDLLGNRLQTKAFVYQPGDLLNLDLASLSTGVYSIELRQNGQSERLKVARQAK